MDMLSVTSRGQNVVFHACSRPSAESISCACRHSIDKQISNFYTNSCISLKKIQFIQGQTKKKKPIPLRGWMCLGKVNLPGMRHVLTDNHNLKFNNVGLQPGGHETRSTHKRWPVNSFKTLLAECDSTATRQPEV